MRCKPFFFRPPGFTVARHAQFQQTLSNEPHRHYVRCDGGWHYRALWKRSSHPCNWIINVCYLQFTQWIFIDNAKQQQNASLVLLINDICAELCRTWTTEGVDSRHRSTQYAGCHSKIWNKRNVRIFKGFSMHFQCNRSWKCRLPTPPCIFNSCGVIWLRGTSVHYMQIKYNAQQRGCSRRMCRTRWGETGEKHEYTTNQLCERKTCSQLINESISRCSVRCVCVFFRSRFSILVSKWQLIYGSLLCSCSWVLLLCNQVAWWWIVLAFTLALHSLWGNSPRCRFTRTEFPCFVRATLPHRNTTAWFYFWCINSNNV